MKKLNLMTELCGIILGAGIYGLAVTGINIPSKLADGGVTGIALLLHNLFGFAPSITSLLFNLPLLLISLFLFGKHAFLRTIVGTFALVFFLHLWESLHIHFAVDSLLINSLMTGFFLALVAVSSFDLAEAQAEQISFIKPLKNIFILRLAKVFS